MSWQYAGSTGVEEVTKPVVQPVSGALHRFISDIDSYYTIRADSSATTYSLFQGWESLIHAPMFNTATCTIFTSMFSGCTSLETVPAYNMNSAGSVGNMFLGCVNLTYIGVVNCKVNLSVANTKLNAEALNILFSNLATVTATRTITITGTPGSISCDRSIATEKGWTVVG